MRTAMRAAAAAVSALALIAPSAAHAQDASFTVEDVELVIPFVTEVSGTVTCTAGDYRAFNVTLFQRPNRVAFGFTDFFCRTDGEVTWTLDVLGGPFHPGPATIAASALICTGGSFCSEEMVVQQMRIRPPG